jgi:cobalamin biosynthesis protein CobD/CbiB
MNLFICQTIAIGCGYILDLLIGDPHWLYHPVRLIGNLISLLESILLKEKEKEICIIYGFVLPCFCFWRFLLK